MKTYQALDYNLSDFDFDLPNELIAQIPAKTRTTSKLLSISNKGNEYYQSTYFHEVINEFNAGDVLVLNNTKVIPARLFGEKLSGGKLEIFVERIQSDDIALCMIKSNRSPKIDSDIKIGENFAKIIERQGIFFLVKLTNIRWEQLLEKKGDIPLPPYITRDLNSDNNDEERYQTVYAEKDGAVAAPTAGLHFDEILLEKIKNKGIEIVYVTLHVGAGTFQPVKTEDLDDHQMHFELFEIPEETKQVINAAKSAGNSIIAVGTTSLRALESSALENKIIDNNGDTNLFIRPGYEFQIVDKLITNFHLPKSSLMMLVSAFSGYEEIKNLYQYAIKHQYRFFSYGDAMFLKCKNKYNRV